MFDSGELQVGIDYLKETVDVEIGYKDHLLMAHKDQQLAGHFFHALIVDCRRDRHKFDV